MPGIQNYTALTNMELAKMVDNTGTHNLTPEVLEHVALRFIEIFRHGNTHIRNADLGDLQREVTPTPFVHA